MRACRDAIQASQEATDLYLDVMITHSTNYKASIPHQTHSFS